MTSHRPPEGSRIPTVLAVSASETRDVIRLALFVPGGRELERAGVSGEWIENPRDGSFADSFSFGTVDPPVLKEIDAAPGALLVKLNDDLREGRDRVVRVVEALRGSGALAVRLEQSKLGWAVDQWLGLVRPGDPWALHRCAVAMLVGDKRVASCGMHAFSLPDASVDMDNMTSEEAQELLSALNIYQLAEDPLLLSGQTFSPMAGSARRVVQRWPDDGYPPDHWCHNPYGLWRLSAEGAQPRPQLEFHSLFIPALVVLLHAREQKAGPLTRLQVEETTGEGGMRSCGAPARAGDGARARLRRHRPGVGLGAVVRRAREPRRQGRRFLRSSGPADKTVQLNAGDVAKG